MYWKYKNKKTNLPENLKSGVRVTKAVSLLLNHDQHKTDNLENYSKDKIKKEWEYYKRNKYQGDNHYLELDYFIDGTYKLLFAVIKDPSKFADIICCVVDKDTNEIHALAQDVSSVDELIKKNKNLNGSEKNGAWWYFYYDECVPYKYAPIHTYTEDMRMPSYLGLWSKDVVLFDNFKEAQEYFSYVHAKVGIKDWNKRIKQTQKIIDSQGTLEEAINKAIAEWTERNKDNLDYIKQAEDYIKENTKYIDEKPDWVKNI